MSERSVQRVAVGLTHAHAASVFGTDHDDVLITTFSDFAVDVDLDALHQVDVAASSDLPAILDALLPNVAAGRLRVRVEYAARVRAPLLRALEARPEIGVASVACVGGRAMVTLAGLEPREARASRVALDALEAASVPARTTGSGLTNPEAPATPGTTRPAPTRSPTPGATPWRRQLLLALGGLVTIVVGPVLAAALAEPHPFWLRATVEASTLGAVLWVGVVLLLLRRDLRRHHSSVETSIRRQRGVIRRRTEAIVAEQRNGQQELQLLARHVEALDVSLSSLRAQVREWRNGGGSPGSAEDPGDPGGRQS